MRSPRSTLFPYTTLFRSVGFASTPLAAKRSHDATCLIFRQPRIVSHDEVAIDLLHQVEGDANEDRKSTRLNSSHSSISYAVFCLKKKRRHPKVDCSRLST